MIDQSDRDAPPRPSTPVPDTNVNVNVNEARLRQQAIGVKLRQMFDQVVSEPVPDEFLDILRRADSQGASGGEG